MGCFPLGGYALAALSFRVGYVGGRFRRGAWGFCLLRVGVVAGCASCGRGQVRCEPVRGGRRPVSPPAPSGRREERSPVSGRVDRPCGVYGAVCRVALCVGRACPSDHGVRCRAGGCVCRGVAVGGFPSRRMVVCVGFRVPRHGRFRQPRRTGRSCLGLLARCVGVVGAVAAPVALCALAARLAHGRGVVPLGRFACRTVGAWRGAVRASCAVGRAAWAVCGRLGFGCGVPRGDRGGPAGVQARLDDGSLDGLSRRGVPRGRCAVVGAGHVGLPARLHAPPG